MLEKQGSADVSPIGETATAARRRRAARSPEYAAERQRLAPAREVAAQLIYYRTRMGLTQQQLADRAGTSHSHISRLESGEHLPNLASLVEIGAALGLTLSVTFEQPDGAAGLVAAD